MMTEIDFFFNFKKVRYVFKINFRIKIASHEFETERINGNRMYKSFPVFSFI